MLFPSIFSLIAVSFMVLDAVSAREQFLFSDQGWNVKEIYEKLVSDDFSVRSQTDIERRWYLPSPNTQGELDTVYAEGQASALLMLGTILASWDKHAALTSGMVPDYFVGFDFAAYFRGWVMMNERSTDQDNCQPNGGMDKCEYRNAWFKPDPGTFSSCLPSKSFTLNATGTDNLGLAELDTGSNSAADADAILGMILALKGAEKLDLYTNGWDVQVKLWLEQAIPAFMEYDTETNALDSSAILTKLGSCDGGWGSAGNNPSYHSPGTYRVMRDWFLEYSSQSSPSSTTFDDLVYTSQNLWHGVQCSTQGMFSNWVAVELLSPEMIQSTGEDFSDGVSPQYEFGVEGVRAIWRIVLNGFVQPDYIANEVAPFLGSIQTILSQGSGTIFSQEWEDTTFGSCVPDGMTQDVYAPYGWTQHSFLMGPITTSMVIGQNFYIPASTQQSIVDAAASQIKSNGFATDYEAFANWAMLSSLALRGVLKDAVASLQPTDAPSASPSVRPQQPSNTPSSGPSSVPSASPSAAPQQPSNAPSLGPSSVPSASPSAAPQQPSNVPSYGPTNVPNLSATPSLRPSSGPSSEPSISPSAKPSASPTFQPSLKPSLPPSSNPSTTPSFQPSLKPSLSPSANPSATPSFLPSSKPSLPPSSNPSTTPSFQPSLKPSLSPSANPSATPSFLPSSKPSLSPSANPSATPSFQPSLKPSLSPSANPSAPPSFQPSSKPSMSPSSNPSASPTATPTTAPVAPTASPFLPTQTPVTTCLARRQSCSVDADCCSGDCRGGRNRRCR